MEVHYGLDKLPIFTNAVLTVGSFDGVHRGHQKLLSRINDLAKEVGGESVLITFDPHPRQIIFPKDTSLALLTTTDEKLTLLERYGVDHIVVIPFSIEFSQQSPQEYIEKVLVKPFAPAYIVIGYDHRYGLNRQGDLSLLQDKAAQYKYQVVEVKKQEIEDIAISSTKIREALMNGDLGKAELLSAHAFTLSGKVISGDQIGQTLGFPTANLKPHYATKLIPAHGVYAVDVDLDGDSYQGMLYIGERPSINDAGRRVIEVHIFDFDDTIYGANLTLTLLEYIREGISFDSKEELVAQLKRDQSAVKHIVGHQAHITATPICTIAVLNYNGEHYLESYLPPLLDSSNEYEVDTLLIDNASSDGSVDYVQEWHPEIRLRALSTNYGFAGGYNKGLESETSTYTAIINNDVLVTDGWLDPIIAALDTDPSIAAVQPKILSLEDNGLFEYAGAAGGFIDRLGYPFCRGRVFDHCEQDTGQYDQAIDIAWSSGACMVIRTDVFKQLGGFDADYFAHQEEIDLCYRIRRAGHRIVCLPSSTVYHLGGGTLDYESPRKTFLNFRNNTATLIKNESALKLLWLLPIRIGLDKIAALKFAVDGRQNNAKAVIKALINVYSHYGKWWTKRTHYRRLIQQYRQGPPIQSGRYSGSILVQYFVKKHKTWTAILGLRRK